MRIIIALVVAVVVVVGVVTFLNANASSSSTDANAEDDATESSSAATELEYRSVNRACDGVDFSFYEDKVGKKPQVEDESTADSVKSTRMTCWIRADDVEGKGIRLHNLGVVAEVHQSAKEAQTDFRNALLSSELDESNTTPLQGSWNEAVSYRIDDDINEGYGLVVQDENATIRVTQLIDPIDSLSEKVAQEIAGKTAIHMLSAMRG